MADDGKGFSIQPDDFVTVILMNDLYEITGQHNWGISESMKI